MEKLACPACGCKFAVMDEKDQEKPGLDEQYSSDESLDSDLKKSVLDELMGLSDEARKNQLPKKGMVSVEMLKVSPKKKA